MSLTELKDARRVQKDYSDRFRAVLRGVDAIVIPASVQPPFALGREAQYGSLTEFAAAVAESTHSRGIGNSFTYPLNFAGTPGLVLPCGFSDEGLPYTMQLVGRQLSEPMLCRIGHAYEEATDWHRRHPQV